MRRTIFGLTLASTLLALFAVSSALGVGARAQDDDGEGEAEAPPAPEPAQPAGPRTESGRAEVVVVIDRRGAVLSLHSKARLVIPAELPVANRRVRFAESREPLQPSQIGAGFARIGPALSFDGAIDASRAPVVVSIAAPRDPSRRGARLVLAMEQPSICGEGSVPLPGASRGICSGWSILPARYDAGERRLSAELRAPGGYRLVFGTLPCAEGDTAPGCAAPAAPLPL